MATPTSQRADARPISFLLEDLENANELTSVSLVIRPEDLTHTEPSRLSTQQTLDGAWVDNFGPGLRTISITGHTGWRGQLSGRMDSVGTKDGFALFKELHDTVYRAWHAKREQAIKSGRDPNKVQLIFADLLDEMVVVVAPVSFVLRRSRTRPLLLQYQISLTVLADLGEQAVKDLLPTVDEQAVPESLRDSLEKLSEWSRDIADLIDGSLGLASKEFMDTTTDVLRATQATVDSVTGSVDTVAASAIGVAKNLTQAGKNIFQTVAAVASVPVHVKARCMEIAAAYGNAFCTLSNAFRVRHLFPDYSALYGASYCSSTTGGRPLSPLRNENPLYRLEPARPAPPVMQTPEAQQATEALATVDVLLAQPDTNMIAHMRTVAGGTTAMAA